MASTSIGRGITARGSKGKRGGKDRPGKHTGGNGGAHGGGGNRGILGKEVITRGGGANGVQGPSQERTVCEPITRKGNQEG